MKPVKVPGSAPTLTPAGQSSLVKGAESGRCIDLPSSTQLSGTQVTLWDCSGGTNQKWTATYSKQLMIYGTRCLDAKGSGTTDGTPVIVWSCHGGANQQWQVMADGTIVSIASGKCLDAAGHGTGKGTKLQLWTCNGGKNQQWARS